MCLQIIFKILLQRNKLFNIDNVVYLRVVKIHHPINPYLISIILEVTRRFRNLSCRRQEKLISFRDIRGWWRRKGLLIFLILSYDAIEWLVAPARIF